MLISEVQSEQVRILQAHGRLTTPRMSQVLDYAPDALQWMADNWESSSTPEDNREVRQVATEALAFVANSRLLGTDG